MGTTENQIVSKQLHTNAETLVKEYSAEYTDALLLQSKTLAKLEGTDEVQSVHVQKAKIIVLGLTQQKNDVKNLLFGLGCVFLGISIQGAIGEYLATTPRIGWMLIYTILGIFSGFTIAAVYRK